MIGDKTVIAWLHQILSNFNFCNGFHLKVSWAYVNDVVKIVVCMVV